MKKDEVERLVRGEHHEPHRLLGAHTEDGRVVIRAFRPEIVMTHDPTVARYSDTIMRI